MIKLLIAADDLTGALDTGVRFAHHGVQTLVTTDFEIDQSTTHDNIEVLVIDTQTRHLSGSEAYTIVFSLIKKAVSSGIETIYKKTDSILRGNIGDELLAVINATRCKRLMFIPAFPDSDRTTCNGIQYVSGVPIAQSHLAQDPFNPVINSYIPDIINRQTHIETITVKTGENIDFEEHCGIFIFDAKTNEDMRSIGNTLKLTNQLNITAGCAGFAAVLCNLLEFNKVPIKPNLCKGRFLIVSGSVNNTSIEQMRHIKENGVAGITLTSNNNLNDNYSINAGVDEHTDLIIKALNKSSIAYIEAVEDNTSIIQSNGPIVAKSIGNIVKNILKNTHVDNIIIIGGDTLLAILSELKITKIEPLTELSPGVAFSKINSNKYSFNLITKSGGFGTKETILNIASMFTTATF